MPLLCKVRISCCTASSLSNTEDLWNTWSKTTKKILSWTSWPVICQLLWPVLTFWHLLVVCTDQTFWYLLLTFICRNSTTCVSRVNTPGLLVGGKILGNLGMAAADWLPTLFCINGKEKKKKTLTSLQRTEDTQMHIRAYKWTGRNLNWCADTRRHTHTASLTPKHLCAEASTQTNWPPH